MKFCKTFLKVVYVYELRYEMFDGVHKRSDVFLKLKEGVFGEKVLNVATAISTKIVARYFSGRLSIKKKAALRQSV